MDDSKGAQAPISLPELHRAIGAVVVAATNLEYELGQAVMFLARAPLVSIIVQGERGSVLARMAQRLLKKGVGSTKDDEISGKTIRHGLISAEDTDTFCKALKQAEFLLKERDAVVHSTWLVGVPADVVKGRRSTRATEYVRSWTLAELEGLRQGFADTQEQIFDLNWKINGSGLLDPALEGDS